MNDFLSCLTERLAAGCFRVDSRNAVIIGAGVRELEAKSSGSFACSEPEEIQFDEILSSHLHTPSWSSSEAAASEVSLLGDEPSPVHSSSDSEESESSPSWFCAAGMPNALRKCWPWACSMLSSLLSSCVAITRTGKS